MRLPSRFAGTFVTTLLGTLALGSCAKPGPLPEVDLAVEVGGDRARLALVGVSAKLAPLKSHARGDVLRFEFRDAADRIVRSGLVADPRVETVVAEARIQQVRVSYGVASIRVPRVPGRLEVFDAQDQSLGSLRLRPQADTGPSEKPSTKKWIVAAEGFRSSDLPRFDRFAAAVRAQLRAAVGPTVDVVVLREASAEEGLTDMRASVVRDTQMGVGVFGGDGTFARRNHLAFFAPRAGRRALFALRTKHEAQGVIVIANHGDEALTVGAQFAVVAFGSSIDLQTVARGAVVGVLGDTTGGTSVGRSKATLEDEEEDYGAADEDAWTDEEWAEFWSQDSGEAEFGDDSACEECGDVADWFDDQFDYDYDDFDGGEELDEGADGDDYDPGEDDGQDGDEIVYDDDSLCLEDSCDSFDESEFEGDDAGGEDAAGDGETSDTLQYTHSLGNTGISSFMSSSIAPALSERATCGRVNGAAMDCAYKTPSWVGWFGSAGYKFTGTGSQLTATPFTKGIAGTLISTIAGFLQGRMGQFGAVLKPFAAGGGAQNAIASVTVTRGFNGQGTSPQIKAYLINAIQLLAGNRATPGEQGNVTTLEIQTRGLNGRATLTFTPASITLTLEVFQKPRLLSESAIRKELDTYAPFFEFLRRDLVRAGWGLDAGAFCSGATGADQCRRFTTTSAAQICQAANMADCSIVPAP